MKPLRLRFSIGVLFALAGIFFGLFATAGPFDSPSLRYGVASASLAAGALTKAATAIEPHGPFPMIRLQPVASGFASPVTVTNAGDGSGRLFVVQQPGQIRILINGTVLPTPLLDIHDLVSCCGEQGLLGLAFHPDYVTNGFFYVDYTDVNGATKVARYAVSAKDPNVADPGSAHTILAQAQPFSNHNGGQLAFDPDVMAAAAATRRRTPKISKPGWARSCVWMLTVTISPATRIATTRCLRTIRSWATRTRWTRFGRTACAIPGVSPLTV